MSIPRNDDDGLAGAIKQARYRSENPLADSVKSGIYTAITVDAVDPEGRGRVAAYIPKLGGTPLNPDFFQYASPFGGTNGVDSYGFFAVPPDPGITILVFYAENGDMAEGFWFAVSQQAPNIVSGGAHGEAKIDGSGQGEGIAAGVPAAKSNQSTVRDTQTPPEETENSNRNVNVSEQGLYSDSVRGQSTASPRRDANYSTPGASKVYGIATPGQNALTMDDGSVGDDGTIHPTQIRLTTGSGAGVILDGTNDLIYMVNSSGSGWIEIGADGNIMAYGSGSISMRAEGDLNFRADRNINIETNGNFHVKTGGNVKFDSAAQLHLKSSGYQFLDCGGSMHLKVSSNMYASTGGKMHLNGPQAAMSPGISTMALPDIKNLQSTKVESSWKGGGSSMSTMPSHEPMMRQSPPRSDNDSVPRVPDPNSVSQNRGSGEPFQGAAPNLSDSTGSADGLARIRSKNGVEVSVAAIFQEAFQGFITDLENTGYVIKTMGGYVRRSARNSSRPSFHAMGAAIDINAFAPNGFESVPPAGWDPNRTRGAQWQCDFPLNVGEIAARHGLGWGGNWTKPWDPMHFSAASAERGAWQLTRRMGVAVASDVRGTVPVRLA